MKLCVRVSILKRNALTFSGRVATYHIFVMVRLMDLRVKANSVFAIVRHVDMVEVLLVDVPRVSLLQRAWLSV